MGDGQRTRRWPDRGCSDSYLQATQNRRACGRSLRSAGNFVFSSLLFHFGLITRKSGNIRRWRNWHIVSYSSFFPFVLPSVSFTWPAKTHASVESRTGRTRRLCFPVEVRREKSECTQSWSRTSAEHAPRNRQSGRPARTCVVWRAVLSTVDERGATGRQTSGDRKKIHNDNWSVPCGGGGVVVARQPFVATDDLWWGNKTAVTVPYHRPGSLMTPYRARGAYNKIFFNFSKLPEFWIVLYYIYIFLI